MSVRRVALLASAIAGDAVVLLQLAEPASRAAAVLHNPQQWLDRVGPDAVAGTLAAGLLWLVALWFALGLGAAALTYAPGRTGRQAGALTRLMLPRTLTRLVAGATGMGILLAPIAANATLAGRGLAGRELAGPGPAGPVPTPNLPMSPPHTALPAPELPTGTARAPHTEVAPRQSAPPAAGDTSAVRVQAGDSLWTITARSLGPTATPAHIAARWPRWYLLNRSVVGTDPDLIRPGQVLYAPSSKEQP